MRLNIKTALIFLSVGIAAASVAADPAAKPATRPADGQWFQGMLHPPKVNLKLPDEFTLASLSPGEEWSMYDGVVWSPARSANMFAHQKEKKFAVLEDPLVWVHLSSSVGQTPGTDNFTVEKGLDAMAAGLGLKKVSKRKLHWGAYPVLAFGGEKPNGSMFFMAWVGINSPDGWALLLDYRLPAGKGHPTAAELEIWKHLLEDTTEIPRK